MYIEIGPASLVIEGEKDGKSFEFDKARLENKLKEILKDIRDYLPILRQKAYRIKNVSYVPEVVRKMVEATKMVDETTLTPMAAVAGTVSDMVRGFLLSEGYEFISVNNGGDISIYNQHRRVLRIGIGDIRTGKPTPYALSIEGLRDYGLATSGFGGRSFTLGMAEMGTVLAGSGALSDAAATYICNKTNTDTDKVIRKKASEIDPLTDIPEEFVTVGMKNLDDGVITEALRNGLYAAQMLKQNNIIYDAAIVLGGNIVTTINGNKNIKLEVQNGSKENSHHC
jgi:ApbE superfamily uncharacterized protein (UPF0280 family)